eukprot:CAMPEP_0174742692 /NCGR_PEP_ID=MMETSP1094-20130205/79600_1 /TAXON_ID=156173 /ORGANISM="Chrysochromulina brevifilum, Strain UTEX LB 985" /LENGTH=49 /DNA_ID=CAMNT_0015946779 /DNA_START=119 /DNA_END=268 /DNA_ORIENTATION=-
MPDKALDAGCKLGAYVASRPGATPRHEPVAIAALLPRTAGGTVPLPLEQ